MSNLNPKDEIRQKMLHYFYERAQRSRSKFGKYGFAVKIKELKADLKDLHGLSQQPVMPNLQYLVDRGWVNEKTETKKAPTPGGMTVESTTTYHEISAEGTDRIAGSHTPLADPGTTSLLRGLDQSAPPGATPPDSLGQPCRAISSLGAAASDRGGP
jgi:hypothetical protein